MMAACRANLLQLPEEILLHILSYLPPEDIIFRVRPTCWYFHDLTLMPDFWKSVTLTRFSNKASACFGADRPASRFACEKFCKMMLRQKCIKSSCGNECVPKKNKRNQMNSLITSVEERGNVWHNCSATIARRYPRLKKLKMKRERLLPAKFLVSYSGLVHLQLEVTHVVQESHQNFYGENIVDLFQSLKGLTSLQVLKIKCVCSHCENTVQRADIPRIAESLIDYFLTGPRLRQLELSTSLLQNDEILKTVLDKCSQVKDLALVSPDLTPNAFAQVSKETQKLTGLRSLRITDCAELDDTCLEAMSIAFPNLSSLELTLTVKMTDEGVGHLLRTCRQLTFLKLTSPDYETASVGFGGNAQNIITGDCLKELAHSGNLQTLILENFSLLSDPVFKELCQHQVNLHTLELTNCWVSTSDMRTLADSCPLLQTVIIVKCSNVDSTAVVFLMENLLRLQTLRCNFSGRHQLYTGHLQSVRKRTRSRRPVLQGQQKKGSELRSLELLPCRNLTAWHVLALTLPFPNLNHLSLRAEKILSENVIREILSTCKQLKHLTLERYSDEIPGIIFTEACLKDIQEKGTRLQSLHLLARRRGFSLASLAKLLAQSSTLVDCTVPKHLLNERRSYCATSLIKQLNEAVRGLTHQRKNVCGWLGVGSRDDTQSPLYKWNHLKIKIYSRLPTTKAVK